MKTIVLASSGTGKGMAAQLCDKIKDLDTIEFAFVYDKKMYGELGVEELKNLINGWIAHPENYPEGSIRWNPEAPGNYIKAIEEALEGGDTALLPFIKETYEMVEQLFKGDDIRRVMVFPEKDNFGEYEQIYKKRGNDENFINERRKQFGELAKIFDEAKGYEKVRLGKKKHLLPELVKRGIVRDGG
jgi:hypothetical protein